MRPLTGTLQLIRLVVRTDRVRLPVWILAIAWLVIVTALAFEFGFADQQMREVIATQMAANPGMNALTGPTYDLVSTGGLTAWRIAGTSAGLAGIMSILQVIRHTRTEEETGRAELLGASSVGRYATIAAALSVVGVANLLVALLVGVGLAAIGLPVASGFLLGFGIAAAGLVFGALAVVSAQVFSSARAANTFAIALLGLTFLLRAAGDVGSETMSWFSPLGWAHRLRPYAGDRWFVLLLPLTVTVLLLGLGFLLIVRRDQGSGIIVERTGRPIAPASLSGPLGLAWRLQRATVLAWVVAFAVFGTVFALVSRIAEDVIESNPSIGGLIPREMLRERFADGFFSAILMMFGLVASAFVIHSVLRARAEETATRAEPVLAGSIERWRWLGGHVTIAALGLIVVLGSLGLALGVVRGIQTGDLAGQVMTLVGAALVQAPPALVTGAVAIVLLGAFPAQSGLAWAFLGGCLVLNVVSSIFDLPWWVLYLSPYSHTPLVPVQSVDFPAMLGLVVVAVLLTGLGGFALRRRDIG